MDSETDFSRDKAAYKKWIQRQISLETKPRTRNGFRDRFL